MRVRVKESRPPAPRPAVARVLSQNQQAALAVIKQYQAEFGMPPTRMEIAQRLGLKYQRSVDVRLKGLEERGAIETYPSTSRGVRVLEEGPEPLDHELPVMDREEFLAATKGEEERSDDGDIIRRNTLGLIGRRFAERPEGFLLVTEETAGLGYGPGDLVALSREREPKDGEGVAARIGDKIRLGSFRENQGTKEVQVNDVATGTTEAIGDETEEAEVLAIVIGGIITTGCRGSCDNDANGPEPAMRART